jgi:hypothetical protein
MPDWQPSWLTTDEHGNKVETKNWYQCEDSLIPTLTITIFDATRISDGVQVTLKTLSPSKHPYEAEIGTYFSCQPLASDPKNHSVPIYEVLQIPDMHDRVILVMPLLRFYDNPRFQTFGETVDFFSQVFEGLKFMHDHHVAHRDCMGLNIMMDGPMYPDGWHPCLTYRNRDATENAKHYTRTERPPKYYFIDFGISRRYNPKDGPPLEDPIFGGDKTVPEFQTSIAPCNPFPTDVYYLGNMIRLDFIKDKIGFNFMNDLVNDMVQDDPAKRPSMDEVVRRFEDIRQRLSGYKLRSRVARRKDGTLKNIYRSVSHIGQLVRYSLSGLPAIPAR